MKQFIPTKIYKAVSACDSNCVWSYTILSRTPKTVKILTDDNTILTRRITVWQDQECFYPLGTYSMCPIVRA